MKHCILVSISICLLRSVAYAFSGLKKLRVHKLGAPKATSHSSNRGSPLQDSIWASLDKFRWTVFLGDSVLGAQFLTLSQELGATPVETSLAQHHNCTEKDGAWPTQEAMMDLTDQPFEYLLLCGPEGCKFSRLGCMNFYSSVCSDKDHCVKGCEGTAVWDNMLVQIMQHISKQGHFAVSFHWAPSYFPHMNVYDRLGRYVPGKLLWNNCHHWIGHGYQVDQVAEPTKLSLWLSYVDSSAAVLQKVVGLERLAYQGCTRILCEGNIQNTDNSRTWVEKCNGRRQWLEKADAAAEQLITGRGMQFIGLDMLLPDAVLRAAFLDGSHPCMPIPCMWQNTQVHPPRQCCQALVVHSLDSLGGFEGSGGGTWDVPTLVSNLGSRSNGSVPIKTLFEDYMGVWDEARPTEMSQVNQSLNRSYI